MRTLNRLPEERRLRVLRETRDIYADCATSSALVRCELEELAFKYLEPQACDRAADQGRSQARAAEGLIQRLTATIEAKLREAQIPAP